MSPLGWSVHLGLILNHQKGSAWYMTVVGPGSRSRGCAVNDFAPLGTKVWFQSLDDAVQLLQPGGYSGFEERLSLPLQRHVLLFFLVMMTLFSCMIRDTRLSFGSSLAPKIFLHLTQAMKRMMAHRGYHIVAYLDDFYIHAHTLMDVMKPSIPWLTYCGPWGLQLPSSL